MVFRMRSTLSFATGFWNAIGKIGTVRFGLTPTVVSLISWSVKQKKTELHKT